MIEHLWFWCEILIASCSVIELMRSRVACLPTRTTFHFIGLFIICWALSDTFPWPVFFPFNGREMPNLSSVALRRLREGLGVWRPQHSQTENKRRCQTSKPDAETLLSEQTSHRVTARLLSLVQRQAQFVEVRLALIAGVQLTLRPLQLTTRTQKSSTSLEQQLWPWTKRLLLVKRCESSARCLRCSCRSAECRRLRRLRRLFTSAVAVCWCVNFYNDILTLIYWRNSQWKNLESNLGRLQGCVTFFEVTFLNNLVYILSIHWCESVEQISGPTGGTEEKWDVVNYYYS